MTQAALQHLDAVPFGERKRTEAPLANLSCMGIGDTAWVIALALEDEMAAWLRAVGVGEGECITVLRRAALGGPIHVRTGSGGEFALHRTLARSVILRAVSKSERDRESAA